MCVDTLGSLELHNNVRRKIWSLVNKVSTCWFYIHHILVTNIFMIMIRVMLRRRRRRKEEEELF
jgi:hypothetical protein